MCRVFREWRTGPAEVREPGQAFARKPGDPKGDRPQSTVGPVEKGQWPQSRHEHTWEVGHGMVSVKRMNKGVQPDKTGQPPAVCGEKDRGRGKFWAADRKWYTGTASSVQRTDQDTRGSEKGLAATALHFVPFRRAGVWWDRFFPV
jgi:hypothetical protein